MTVRQPLHLGSAPHHKLRRSDSGRLLGPLVGLAWPNHGCGSEHQPSPRLLNRTVKHVKTTRSLFVALMALVCAAVPAQAAAQATTSTTVSHPVPRSQFFPDDICGLRANVTTFDVRTSVEHISFSRSGAINYTFVETGTYRVDFVDPAFADQESQFTETIHFTQTPGGNEIVTTTFHDFPTGIRIYSRVHFTVFSDGRVVVDREINKVTGCP